MLLGLPFLCKKHECLLLTAEHFNIFGSDACNLIWRWLCLCSDWRRGCVRLLIS